METIELNIKTALNYFELDINQITDKSVENSDRIALMRNAMNRKIKDIRTFEDLETFIEHVPVVGGFKIYLKNTKFIASDFEEVDSFEHMVRYRYGYGTDTEVYDVDKLYEIIEVR